MSCNCPECQKKTERTQEERKALKNRLNRLIGQINGIEKMIDEDRYCVDILMQCAAISKAFGAIEREIFSSHLKGCITRDIKEGKDEVYDETMDIIERLMR